MMITRSKSRSLTLTQRNMAPLQSCRQCHLCSVKCDRGRPCSTCIEAGRECTYDKIMVNGRGVSVD